MAVPLEKIQPGQTYVQSIGYDYVEVQVLAVYDGLVLVLEPGLPEDNPNRIRWENPVFLDTWDEIEKWYP